MNDNLRSGFRSGRDRSGRDRPDRDKPERGRSEQTSLHGSSAPAGQRTPAPSSLRMRSRLRQLFRHSHLQKPIFWIGTLLGILWALPLSIVGLLVALPVFAWRGHAQLIRGRTVALLVRGPLADILLSHHPFGAMAAMALGHIIIAEQQGLSARVLMHELAHVRQAQRWGIVFPFAYLASSAWAGIRGRDAYWHNRFEIAARKAEKHF